MIQVASLHIYPVKSCGSTPLERMPLDERGPVNDRRLMLVDKQGTFITQRSEAKLALIGVRREGKRLELNAPGMEPLQVNLADGSLRPIEVWRYHGDAHIVSREANIWFSQFLQQEVTLVGCPENMARLANPDWAVQTTPLSFVDGYPILILSEASVEELNTRLDEPVSAMRFRPNIILRDTDAFAEDAWSQIRIGNIILDILKPCDRCSVVSIDPHTGKASKEPLATLANFRRSPAGVLFGQNCNARASGSIAPGDPVKVLETRPAASRPPAFRIKEMPRSTDQRQSC